MCASLLLAIAASCYAADDYPDYQLKQVVVLSRHNIRSPMSEKGSILDEITPHDWFEWTSNPSELSLRNLWLDDG